VDEPEKHLRALPGQSGKGPGFSHGYETVLKAIEFSRISDTIEKLA